MRYVVHAAEPFIVKPNHTAPYYDCFRGQSINDPLQTVTSSPGFALVYPVLTEHANASSPRCMPADEPLRTICASTKGGHHALVSAFLAKHYGGVVGSDLHNPIGTVTSIDHHSLVTANLVRNFGKSAGGAVNNPAGTIVSKSKDSLVTAHLIRQFGQSVGSSPEDPVGTITPGGLGKTGLVASHLVKLRGTCRDGQPVDAPAPTVTASGTHIGEVRCFIVKYYGSAFDADIGKPLHTITTKDRMALVSVDSFSPPLTDDQRYRAWQVARFLDEFHGHEPENIIPGPRHAALYVHGGIIVDIGMRMLSPRELFRAQGFPDTYIIDPEYGGKRLTKTAQVRMCGNSVSPWPAAALVRANCCTDVAVPETARA